MARIEDRSKQKSKKNLASKIWTGFVIGLLSAVFLGMVVLGCVYLFGNNDEETEETTFEEQYPEAQLITWEDLANKILDPNPDGYDLIGNGYMYVFVYSPDYETYPNGEKVSNKVNDAVAAFGDNEGDDRFYVINVEAEDNKGFNLGSSEYLSSLASNGSPYLLVIGREKTGNITIEEVIDGYRDINNKLAEITR